MADISKVVIKEFYVDYFELVLLVFIYFVVFLLKGLAFFLKDEGISR